MQDQTNDFRDYNPGDDVIIGWLYRRCPVEFQPDWLIQQEAEHTEIMRVKSYIGDDVRAEIETRFLQGQDDKVIAAELGVYPATVLAVGADLACNQSRTHSGKSTSLRK